MTALSVSMAARVSMTSSASPPKSGRTSSERARRSSAAPACPASSSSASSSRMALSLAYIWLRWACSSTKMGSSSASSAWVFIGSLDIVLPCIEACVRLWRGGWGAGAGPVALAPACDLCRAQSRGHELRWRRFPKPRPTGRTLRAARNARVRSAKWRINNSNKLS